LAQQQCRAHYFALDDFAFRLRSFLARGGRLEITPCFGRVYRAECHPAFGRDLVDIEDRLFDGWMPFLWIWTRKLQLPRF
jgi:hypothetical protein